MSTTRKTVLFLCTGNSCRSQMAEGWANKLHAQYIEARSAGTNPHPVNALAIKVMAEAGVDISRHKSKHLESLSDVQFDLVVTVCDSAASQCPTPPKGTRLIHIPFDDPPQLARGSQNEDEALHHYRRIRDEIKKFISQLPLYLDEPANERVE